MWLTAGVDADRGRGPSFKGANCGDDCTEGGLLLLRCELTEEGREIDLASVAGGGWRMS